MSKGEFGFPAWAIWGIKRQGLKARSYPFAHPHEMQPISKMEDVAEAERKRAELKRRTAGTYPPKEAHYADATGATTFAVKDEKVAELAKDLGTEKKPFVAAGIHADPVRTDAWCACS